MQKKTTLNVNEILKFSKNADQWWQVNGKYKLLHDITPIRLEFIKSMIVKFFNYPDNIQNSINTRIDLSDLNILDVGCGGGLVSIPLAKHGAKMTAIDASKENIAIAKTEAENYNLNINFISDTIDNCNEKKSFSKKFNVILALEVIEHIEDVAYFMQHLIDNLNDKGILIISTINKSLNAFIYTKLIAEYLLNWIEIGTHEFEKYVKPSDLYNLATKFNLKLLHQAGLKYNIYDRSWYLTENLNTNYFAVYQKN